MKTHKGRVFLAARKRQVPLEQVYDLLKKLGFPPTHRQVPVNWGKVFEVRFAGYPANHHDYREISRQQADIAISLLSGN